MNHIRQAREKRGISQAELARRIGVSKQSISLYERGERAPRMDTLEALSNELNTSIPFLQGLTDMSVPQGMQPFFVPDNLRPTATKLAALNAFLEPEGYSIDLGAIGEGTVALRGPRGWHELSQDEISKLLNTTVGGIDAWLNSMDDSRALSPEKDGDD